MQAAHQPPYPQAALPFNYAISLLLGPKAMWNRPVPNQQQGRWPCALNDSCSSSRSSVSCVLTLHTAKQPSLLQKMHELQLLTLQLQGVQKRQHIDALRISMKCFLGSHCAAGLSASNPCTTCRWNYWERFIPTHHDRMVHLHDFGA